MLKVAVKSIAVWLVIVIAAIFNGAIREKLLTPFIGPDISLPLSGITLSALVFIITYFAIPFFGNVKSRVYLLIGVFWTLLTLAFEYLFGHYVMGTPWHEIHQVFTILNGNLFIIVLIVTALSPWAAARLRGKT